MPFLCNICNVLFINSRVHSIFNKPLAFLKCTCYNMYHILYCIFKCLNLWINVWIKLNNLLNHLYFCRAWVAVDVAMSCTAGAASLWERWTSHSTQTITSQWSTTTSPRKQWSWPAECVRTNQWASSMAMTQSRSGTASRHSQRGRSTCISQRDRKFYNYYKMFTCLFKVNENTNILEIDSCELSIFSQNHENICMQNIQVYSNEFRDDIERHFLLVWHFRHSLEKVLILLSGSTSIHVNNYIMDI